MAAKDETNTDKKGTLLKTANTPVMVHDPLADLDAGGLEQADVEAVQEDDMAGESDVAQVPEQDSSASGEVALGEALTIADVGEWCGKITAVLDRSEPVRLQGEDLDQIDSAGIQFLVAVMQEAAALGIEVSWAGVSDVLRSASEQLGLNGALHLSELE